VTAGVLAVIVAAVLSLARGGGGSERAARPASTQRTASAASAAGFPAAAQRAYLDACVGNTPNRRPFCDYTIGQLQHSMTWSEFRQVGQQATAGDSPARQPNPRVRPRRHHQPSGHNRHNRLKIKAPRRARSRLVRLQY